MNDENPVVRQIANVITTLAFFALIGFLALHQSLREQSIAWILGAFTVGTSGVKLTKHVSNGVSVSRMRAVRPHRRSDDPPEGGGSGGVEDTIHTSITRQVERQGGPGPYEREPRGKGPGGIIRRLVVDWGQTVLALVLGAVVIILASEPVAVAAPAAPKVPRVVQLGP